MINAWHLLMAEVTPLDKARYTSLGRARKKMLSWIKFDAGISIRQLLAIPALDSPIFPLLCMVIGTVLESKIWK